MRVFSHCQGHHVGYSKSCPEKWLFHQTPMYVKWCLTFKIRENADPAACNWNNWKHRTLDDTTQANANDSNHPFQGLKKLPTKNPIATSLKPWCLFYPVFSNIKTHGGTHWAHHPLNWMTPLCLQRNFCWHLCCFSIHLISYSVDGFFLSFLIASDQKCARNMIKHWKFTSSSSTSRPTFLLHQILPFGLMFKRHRTSS